MISLNDYLSTIDLPNENVIYGLCEPNTKNVRYIGKAKNLIKRIKNHYKLSKLIDNTHKNNWLKLLLNNGERPSIIILEKCSDYSSLNNSEIKWIEYYKSNGYDLTNGTYGGDGGVLTPESIEKMKETKRIVGQIYWAAGRKFTTEHKENISKGKKGTKLSDEHKKKLSEIHKGLNTWSKGRKHSDESRIKMSESLKGKPRNTEPVYQLDLDNNIIKLWDYPTKAENELGLPRTKIHSVCTGKRKTTGGFKWCYVKDYNINLIK